MIRVGFLICFFLFIAGKSVFAQSLSQSDSEVIAFSEAEKSAIFRHGPWPPPEPPLSQESASKAAIELGEKLFSDPGLSPDGAMSCTSCHQSDIGFTDGIALGKGREPLIRNTLSLFNTRWQRWFGWDGANDSLWAQSIRPILAPQELGASASHVKQHINTSPALRDLFSQAWGAEALDAEAEQVLVMAAKSLSAFQETLTTGLTPFDHFREALKKNDVEAMAQYPPAAQRGLKIFIGEGRCHLCHFGPMFTNLEFAEVGIPYFTADGKVDSGRYEGIKQLKSSPFNRLGIYSNDDSGRKQLTRQVRLLSRNWGEFRIPSLRSVATTAPYMHNGSLATLTDVVRHYSEINEDRLHIDGGKILRPLNLSAREIDDLVQFLCSLSQETDKLPEECR